MKTIDDNIFIKALSRLEQVVFYGSFSAQKTQRKYPQWKP